MSNSIQSINSANCQPIFGQRRQRRSALKYYSSIAVGGAAAGTLVEGIHILCNRGAYPTTGIKLKAIGKEAALWAGIAVIFNGAINLFNKLVNN